MVKAYWMLWAALLVICAILFVAGSFTLTVGITFGFVAFGMIFMGMIGVLPTMVTHPSPEKSSPKQTKAAPAAEPSPLGTRGHTVHA